MMFYMSVPPPFCFCSPKGTIMKIRSILTCIMLSLPQYLIVKLLDAYIVFCKVVFYTHLLYLFLLWQINTYLLTYLNYSAVAPVTSNIPGISIFFLGLYLKGLSTCTQIFGKNDKVWTK